VINPSLPSDYWSVRDLTDSLATFGDGLDEGNVDAWQNFTCKSQILLSRPRVLVKKGD
jgi:hypothetical protein